MHALTLALFVLAASPQAVPGWMLGGSDTKHFEISLDPAAHSGRACGKLAATDGVTGYATLMQWMKAQNYRGKRVRFSALVKTDVQGWAGLWMRVDQGH